MGSQAIILNSNITCELSQACSIYSCPQSSSIAKVSLYGRFGNGLYECWIV